MTGGSRVAQGATLITTCRADKDTARALSQINVKDQDLNIAKYEMCLAPSLKRARTEAYTNVISKDPSAPVGNQTCKTALPIENGETHPAYRMLQRSGVNKFDNSMSSFYRDFYDARSEFELFMVMNQISLHVDDTDFTTPEKKKWNNLTYFNGMLDAGATSPTPGTPAAPNSCRKHPIIFTKLKTFTDFSSTPGVITQKIRGVVGDSYVINERALVIAIDGLDEDNFLEHLSDVINQVYSSETPKIRKQGEAIPSVNTPKNPVGFAASIDPPSWTFQGFSLGSASLDQRDGDNCFSVLRSGAFTCRNGPFHINSGDDLIWVRHKELVCFNKDGYRHLRPVATPENIMRCIFKDKYQERVTGLYTSMQAKVAIAANADMVARGKVDPTGDHTSILRTYTIAPLRTSFKSLTSNASIMDNTRRIGSALSNGSGGSQVDILIGSDI